MSPFVMELIEVVQNDSIRVSFGGLVAKSLIVKRLRAFPEVAQKVLLVLAEPDFKMSDVEQLIMQDPALLASVIQLANSAFFSRSKKIEKLETAFVRLGKERLGEVVASVATMGLFEDISGLGMEVRNHCAGTAAVSYELVTDLAPGLADGAYLTGLMHDVGKLLTISVGEDLYRRVQRETLNSPDKLHLIERSQLGYDHAMLAGQVLSLWNFPKPVPKLVAWHHTPSLAYNDPEVRFKTALLRVSNKIDHSLAEAERCEQEGDCVDIESSEDNLDAFCDDEDFHVAEIDAEYLKNKWADLARARRDAITEYK